MAQGLWRLEIGHPIRCDPNQRTPLIGQDHRFATHQFHVMASGQQAPAGIRADRACTENSNLRERARSIEIGLETAGRIHCPRSHSRSSAAADPHPFSPPHSSTADVRRLFDACSHESLFAECCAGRPSIHPIGATMMPIAQNVAHKLPSASAHVQLGLLNIAGPGYELATSEKLRISLNIGPAFSAETSGTSGPGAISCERNGILLTPPDLELSHRAIARMPTAGRLRPARLAIFIVSRDLLADSILELGLRPSDVDLTYQAIEPGNTLSTVAQALLADLTDGSPDGCRATESLAKAMIGRLLLRLRAPVRADPATDSMARVCRHIETRLHDPLTLQSLAEVAGMSQFHFCRVFQRAVGQSPHRYVMAARIEAARRLLRDATAGGTHARQTMLDIALACGFGSSSHFSTQFRRHTGESPLAWRAARP